MAEESDKQLEWESFLPHSIKRCLTDAGGILLTGLLPLGDEGPETNTGKIRKAASISGISVDAFNSVFEDTMEPLFSHLGIRPTSTTKGEGNVSYFPKSFRVYRRDLHTVKIPQGLTPQTYTDEMIKWDLLKKVGAEMLAEIENGEIPSAISTVMFPVLTSSDADGSEKKSKGGKPVYTVYVYLPCFYVQVENGPRRCIVIDMLSKDTRLVNAAKSSKGEYIRDGNNRLILEQIGVTHESVEAHDAFCRRYLHAVVKNAQRFGPETMESIEKGEGGKGEVKVEKGVLLPEVPICPSMGLTIGMRMENRVEGVPVYERDRLFMFNAFHAEYTTVVRIHGGSGGKGGREVQTIDEIRPHADVPYKVQPKMTASTSTDGDEYSRGHFLVPLLLRDVTNGDVVSEARLRRMCIVSDIPYFSSALNTFIFGEAAYCPVAIWEANNIPSLHPAWDIDNSRLIMQLMHNDPDDNEGDVIDDVVEADDDEDNDDDDDYIDSKTLIEKEGGILVAPKEDLPFDSAMVGKRVTHSPMMSFVCFQNNSNITEEDVEETYDDKIALDNKLRDEKVKMTRATLLIGGLLRWLHEDTIRFAIGSREFHVIKLRLDLAKNSSRHIDYELARWLNKGDLSGLRQIRRRPESSTSNENPSSEHPGAPLPKRPAGRDAQRAKDWYGARQGSDASSKNSESEKSNSNGSVSSRSE